VPRVYGIADELVVFYCFLIERHRRDSSFEFEVVRIMRSLCPFSYVSTITAQQTLLLQLQLVCGPVFENSSFTRYPLHCRLDYSASCD
jgi:hypothetical protein